MFSSQVVFEVTLRPSGDLQVVPTLSDLSVCVFLMTEPLTVRHILPISGVTVLVCADVRLKKSSIVIPVGISAYITRNVPQVDVIITSTRYHQKLSRQDPEIERRQPSHVPSLEISLSWQRLAVELLLFAQPEGCSL